MDPLSLALGVLAVVQTAAAAAEKLYDFAKTVNEAPQEVASLVREANNLYGVLGTINGTFQDPDVRAYIADNPEVETGLASLKEPLSECEKRIAELMVKLEQNTERSGDRGRRVFKSLRWWVVKDDVIATRNSLEYTRGVAHFAISGHNYANSLRQRAREHALRSVPNTVTAGRPSPSPPQPEPSVAELQQRGADLRRAARDGDSILTKRLLDDGTPVDYKNREGRTALSFAAEYGYADIARLLLEHKADVNAQSFEIREGHGYKKEEGKRTPLHWAAAKGRMEVAGILCDAGANIEARTAHDRSAVLEAAMANNISLVTFLLDKGADVNAHTYHGWNMLHTAASQGRLELAELALSRGINVEAKYTGTYHRDSSGVTHQRALHYAVRTQHRPKPDETAMVKLLVEKSGAQLSKQDSKGITPIHSAVRSRWKSALEILLRRATVADLDVKDAKGVTPLEDAMKLGDSNIIDMIKAWQSQARQ